MSEYRGIKSVLEKFKEKIRDMVVDMMFSSNPQLVKADENYILNEEHPSYSYTVTCNGIMHAYIEDRLQSIGYSVFLNINGIVVQSLSDWGNNPYNCGTFLYPVKKGAKIEIKTNALDGRFVISDFKFSKI